LRIGGHCTSIRLERSFWVALEEIAAKEGMSLAKLLTTLHNEVLDRYGEVRNFASLVRCACLVYRSRNPAVSSGLQGGNGRSPGEVQPLEPLERIGGEGDSILHRDEDASFWIT
jgi:predicted DNA-binding ribbon-helix-helix protein